MRDFGIDAYDEGFREAALLPESKRSLSEILSGFSYDSQVLQGFESLLGSEIDFDANAIVLLYNFDADVDRQSEIVSGVVQLRFMGAVDFTPSVV